MEAERQEPPVLEPGYTYASVTDKISALVLRQRTPRGWLIGFALTFAGLMMLLFAVSYLFVRGVGIWGINIPVAWGFAIVNFVWWIGIGHAGTLISAILLLLRQEWRTSVNRFAEAMTLFAVACALLFPLIHLGRPWLFYYMIPYPNTQGLWPQFRSPLVWDLFAVITYGLVSLLFWYTGLIPDLASLRDESNGRFRQVVYGVLAMGWRGSAKHWHRYEQSYYLMAALATPLVISVHSIVGLDFAVSIIPGWHSTITPPFFVAGAIFSGFAMVVTIAVPLRKFYHLEDLITMRHLDNMAKMLLAMSVLVAYGYLSEIFFGWYSGNQFEAFIVKNRFLGPYAPFYWAMLIINVLVPQLFWFKRIRRNVLVLFLLSLVINVGMWLERFIIVVVSLHRDFLPSSWGIYVPTVWDWAILLGSVGLFATLLFLFIRFLPAVSMAEMRGLVGEVSLGETAVGMTDAREIIKD
ncbi:MAG: polysulfide reductase NrfD [Ardenticatenaceae bacterium]|nr:polysulfide reductase NrfD [Ardenticatenaceae bacterium]MCB8987809.1 polysulfide reductase NrfD [Ardenticatenaceae bacterium]